MILCSYIVLLYLHFCSCPKFTNVMDQVPKALVDIVVILYRNANRKLVYPMNIRKISAVPETCCKSIPLLGSLTQHLKVLDHSGSEPSN